MGNRFNKFMLALLAVSLVPVYSAFAEGFADLPATRFTDGADWTGSNYTYSHSAGWSAQYTDYKKTGSAYKYPSADGSRFNPPVLLLTNVPIENEPCIISPVLDGVGIIKYNSRLQDLSLSVGETLTAQVVVQIAKVASPTASDWITIKTNEYENATSGTKQEINDEIVINDVNVKRVRFLRTSYASGYSQTTARVLFDNIALTPMPARVALSPSAYTPANPSQSTPITFNVSVATDSPFAAPDSITSVKVKYQLTSSAVVAPSAGAWQELALSSPSPESFSYTGTLPALNQTGHLWYYYECVYAGYHFGTADNFSPAYNTEAGNSWQTAPTADFYHFEVNEYSADYENVIFDGVESSTAKLVGDNVWEITARIKGLDTVSGHLVGIMGDTETVWGDPDQSSTVAPFGGDLATGASAITITNDAAYTHLVFTNDTANLTYTVAGADLPVIITFENNSIHADPQTNGEKSEVSVNLSTSDGTEPKVCVVYRNHIVDAKRGNLTPGTIDVNGYTKWTTNELDVTDGAQTASFLASGLIPALLDDIVQYYFIASDENILPVPEGEITTSTTNTVMVSAKPGDTRYTGFDNWVRDGQSASITNWYLNCSNGDRWVGTGMGVNNFEVNIVNGKPLPVALLNNYPLDTEASVTSPVLEGGVGSIFYETRIADNGDGELSIQIATVDNPSEFDWQTVEVIKYALKSSGTVHNTPVTLNRYDIKRVRFIRTGSSSLSEQPADGVIILDDIVLSRPPTDVTMQKFLNEPGYPSQYENIKMRCYVTDESENTPAVNRRVKLWYQHTFADDDIPIFRQGNWTSIEMTDMGDNHYFECYVDAQQVGYIWYYFQADYDGYRYDSREYKGSVYLVDGVNGYGNPAIQKSVTPLNKNSDRIQIRPFMSPDGSIFQYATCTPTDPDSPVAVITNELKLVGHNQWQSLLDISKYKHVESIFYAYDHYNTGADYFEPRPRIWGETNQGEDECTAPLGNYLELNVEHPEEDIGPLVVTELEQDRGSLLFRYETENGYYIVKRAVYQDFDEWQASEDNYEESLGGSETLTEETSFDEWTQNYFDKDVRGEGVYTPFYNGDCTSDLFERNTILCTSPGFNRFASRGVEERKKNKNAQTNYALSLEKEFGSLVNNGTGYTRGVEQLTFKARSTIDDDYFAIYKNGTDWVLPLYITASWELTKLGPSKCYFSYILLYQPDLWAGTASWFELRVIQTDSTGDADNAVSLELWRHKADGSEIRIGDPKKHSKGLSLSTAHEVKLAVTKVASGATKDGINVRVTIDGNNYDLADTSTTVAESKSMVQSGGTIGFGVYDAEPKIDRNTIKVGTTASGSEKFASVAASGNDEGAWTKWHNGGNNRWKLSGDYISRSVPSQKIDISYAPCVNYAPAVNAADLVKKTEVTVNSLEYTEFPVSFKVWDPQFIEIKYASGDGGVVIDDPTIMAWRGWTRGQFTEGGYEEASYDWDSVEEQSEWVKKEEGWAVLQGMIDKSAGVSGNSLYFETTRANPPTKDVEGEQYDLPIQGFVSPKLGNGIGSIKFSAQALAGRCVYAVEVSDPTAPESDWWLKTVFTNDVAESEDAVRRFVSIRQLKNGNHFARARIRLMPELSSDDAKIVFDNIAVKDYPPRDAATWLAWNARVTSTSDDPPISYISDPTRIYNASGKSCFLNNSLVNGCADEDFSDHEPYVQSPEVGTGIGEISFQYRCFSNTNATLVIKAAPSEDYPEEDWVTITNMDITGTAYVTFQNEKIYDRDNKVVRFYSSTNSPGRVCIDNILISEPVRASFEFFAVRLLPEQPVVSSNAVIEAEIGRFLMNPRDIKIYVSIHEGDDVWGYTNWWNKFSTPASRRIELKQYGDEKSRVYRSDAVLPATAVDDIVQYVVWGTHAEIDLAAGDPAIYMTENSFKFDEVKTTKTGTVTNSVHYVPWYQPIDLNETYKAQGWSPYYFVYSCAPGSIWFNEVCNYNGSYPTGGEFFELLGYAGIDIGSWNIDLVNYEGKQVNDEGKPFGFVNVHIDHGTKLPAVDKGWGIFVVGDQNVTVANIKLDQYYNNSKADFYGRDSVGGLILSRSNGSYEQRVCFGPSGDCDELVAMGFEYIGRRYSGKGSTIHLYSNEDCIPDDDNPDAGSRTYADFSWPKTGTGDQQTPTPGAYNQGQSLIDISGDIPAVNTYIFISVLHGLHGTQAYGDDAATTQVIEQEVEEGESVTVTYNVNDWYRIDALESNGAAVAAAAGQKTYTFEIAEMTGNVSNDVVFTEYNPYSGCPVSWLSNWSEAEILAGDHDDLDVYDEYLLNTDPTVDTDYSLSFVAIEPGDSDTTFGIELIRSENDTPITSAINGKIGIYGFESLADMGDLNKFGFHEQLDATFHGNTVAGEAFEIGNAKFFKAVVEKAE